MSVSAQPPHSQHQRRRRALAELPLAGFILAANTSPASGNKSTASHGVSPILKPLRAAGSPQASSRGSHSLPRTPPHHSTTPKNIRPHHPHVFSSPMAAPSVQGSPSSAIAKVRREAHPARLSQGQTPASMTKSKASASPEEAVSPAASSSVGSGSSEVSAMLPSLPQSLPHKRERIDTLTELDLARQREQQPIISSPSPRKITSRSLVSDQRHHHRRNSSSASSLMLSPASALRKERAALVNPSRSVDEHAVLSSEEDEEEEVAESEDDEAEEIEVKPLRLSPVALPTATTDMFGAGVASTEGGLIVYQDDTAVSSAEASPSGHAQVVVDGEEKENSEDLFREHVVRLGKRRANSDKIGAESSPSSPGRSRQSPSKSPLSPTSSGNAATPPVQSVKRKKGTGGRLSLLASGDDVVSARERGL